MTAFASFLSGGFSDQLATMGTNASIRMRSGNVVSSSVVIVEQNASADVQVNGMFHRVSGTALIPASVADAEALILATLSANGKTYNILTASRSPGEPMTTCQLETL